MSPGSNGHRVHTVTKLDTIYRVKIACDINTEMLKVHKINLNKE